MARPMGIEHVGAYGHVMDRGNRRPMVFAAAQDYTLFLARRGQFCTQSDGRLLCHCGPSHRFYFCLRSERSGRLGQKSSRN